MENRARRVALMVLFSAVIEGLQAVSQGETLAMWDMPYAEAFPGGLSLGPGGTVYFATNGGMEVSAWILQTTCSVRGALARGRRT